FVVVIREMVTRRSVAAFSTDEGATWSAPVPTGFGGSNHNLTRLRSGALLCAYRDEDPNQYGVSLSVSNDGRSWRFIGQLYRAAAGIRHEPTLYCGYQAIARISPTELLCVLHSYVDDRGHADLHQIRLVDNS